MADQTNDIIAGMINDSNAAKEVIQNLQGSISESTESTEATNVNDIMRELYDALGLEMPTEENIMEATPIPEQLSTPEVPVEEPKTSVKEEPEKPSYLPKGTSEITIDELIEKYGVRPEDIQVVANEHPEIATKIHGGKTMNTLAANATKKRSKESVGYCARGTRHVYEASADTFNIVHSQAFINGRVTYMREGNKQKYKGSDPGADSFYRGLEQTGKFISIDVENKAFGAKTYNNCPSDREMDAYIDSLPPGATVSFDCYTEGDRRSSKAKTGGGKWGHVGVRDNNGNLRCDFTQTDVNSSRYGKEIHVCYPTDAYVPAEYAEMLIEQAKKREKDKSYTYPTEIRMRKGPWAKGKNATKSRATASATRSTPAKAPVKTTSKPSSNGEKTKFGVLDKETKDIANRMPYLLLAEMKREGLIPAKTVLKGGSQGLMTMLSGLELTAEQKEALLAYTHDKKARNQELAALNSRNSAKAR